MAPRLSLESSARRPPLSGTSRPVLRRPVTRTRSICQCRFKRHRRRDSKQFKNFRQLTLILDTRDGIRFIPDISQKNLFGRFRKDFVHKLGDAGFKALGFIGGRRHGGCQKKLRLIFFKFKPEQLGIRVFKPEQFRIRKQKFGCKFFLKPEQLGDCQQKFRHRLHLKPEQRKYVIKFFKHFKKGDLQQAVLGQQLKLLIQQEFLRLIVPQQRHFVKQFPQFKFLQQVVLKQQFRLLIQQEFFRLFLPQQRFKLVLQGQFLRQQFFRREQEQFFGRRRKAEIEPAQSGH